MSRALVLDEDIASGLLLKSLRGRGIDAVSLQDLGLPKGRPDPNVVKEVEARMDGPWVLVTKDLSILEDHPHFQWEEYAIAWAQLPAEVLGEAAEAAKQEIVQNHARRMCEQTDGDLFTYTRTQRHRHPPNLVSHRY